MARLGSYYNMVEVICMNLSQGHNPETLTRAIAAAPDYEITPFLQLTTLVFVNTPYKPS